MNLLERRLLVLALHNRGNNNEEDYAVIRDRVAARCFVCMG